MIPSPVTSENPTTLFISFICCSNFSNSVLFLATLSLFSSNFLSAFSKASYVLSYFSFVFKTSSLKLFIVSF